MLKAIHLTACLAALTGCAASTAAQTPAAAPTAAQAPAADQGQATPAGYLIGPDDVLGIVFWELPNHGGDVIVRPDGKITLPLLNDVQAAGLTPEQLRESIAAASAKYIRDPNVSVVVKQINSLKVYVTGQVTKPGTYPLTSPTTVLQVLALAGGVTDFAKKDKIVVMRTEGGQTRSYKFNYKDVIQGKKLEQNILLKPGDTVVIP
jgi:polysaccharide export outer membrane protein